MSSNISISKMACPSSDTQPVPYTTDIAKMLLISRAAVLQCWPAEEYALKNGTGKKATRSLLNGSLIRLASTTELMHVNLGTTDAKGHRVLLPQNSKDVSIHDIMDEPWPIDQASEHVFEHFLAQAVKAGSLQPMTVHKVAAAVHKVEQAKYWVSLKQKYGNPALPARSKAAVEEQMTACFKSMHSPPGRQLVAMVQAGCEEEEPGEVSYGRRALQAFLEDNRAARQKAALAAQAAAAKQSTSPSPAPLRKASPPSQDDDATQEEVGPQGEAPMGKRQPNKKTAGAKAAVAGPFARPVHADTVKPTLRSSNKRLKTSDEGQQASKAAPLVLLRKPSPGVKQLSGKGETVPVKFDDSPDTVSRRLQIYSRGHEQHMKSAANAPLFHACQLTSSGGAEPTVSPGIGLRDAVLPVAGHPSSNLSRATGGTWHVSPEATAELGSQQAAASDEHLESIITSATIAKLAATSSAQQAKLSQQAKLAQQAQPGNKTSNAQANGVGPHSNSVSTATTGKRKSPHTQKSAVDSSSALPAVMVKSLARLHLKPPQASVVNPADPTTTPPQTPSPSAASPDQLGSGKRKKIRWDPKMAAVNTAAVTAKDHESHATGPLPPGKAVPDSAPTTWPVPAETGRTTPSSATEASAQSGSRQPGRGGSWNAAQQLGGDSSRQDSGGRKELQKKKKEKQSGDLTKVLQVGLHWSWGAGTAMAGHFPAALACVTPLSSVASKGVMPDVTGALRFSRILRLNSPDQQQLAGAVCASVLWVQCTESLVSGMERRESAVLDLDDPSTLEGCGYSSLRGLVERTRLLGCLRQSGAALMLSFASVAEPHQSAAGKTAHQTSTDKSPVVSTHTTAQAIKHSKSKKASLDMAQSAAASRAAGAPSPQQSGQAKMAFSAAAQGTASQSPALDGPTSSDCAEVSAGLWAPQLPAGIKACAVIKDSSADVRTSMLLVAGCHLRLWLSTVKLSQEQQDLVHTFHSAHSSGVYALLLVHAPEAPCLHSDSPSSPPSHPPPPQAHPVSEAKSRDQFAASVEHMPIGMGVTMRDGPVHETVDQDVTRHSITQQCSKLGDRDPGVSDASAKVTTSQPGMTSPAAHLDSAPQGPTKETPASAADPSHHLRDAALAQLLSAPQKPSSHHSAGQAHPARAAPAQRAAGTASGAATLQDDNTVAVQLSVNKQDSDQIELRLQTPPVTLHQQSEGWSALGLPRPPHRKASVGSTPMPIQGPEAELTPEKSGLPSLQLSGPEVLLSSPGKAADQIQDSVLDSPTEAGPSQTLAKPNAAHLSSDRPSGPGQAAPDAITADVLAQSPPSHREASTPPTRGKRSEAIQDELDAAAARFLSGKPASTQADATKPITEHLAAAQPSSAQSLSTAAEGSLSAAAAAAPAPAAAAAAAAGQPAAIRAEPAEAAVREGVTAGQSAAAPAPTTAVLKSNKKQKRTARQAEAGEPAGPEPKRAKKSAQAEPTAAGQQPLPKSEPRARVHEPVKHPGQKPSSPAVGQGHKHPVELPSCTLDCIFRGIRELHLLGSGQMGKERLSKDHLGLLGPLPPLVQLRVLSSYASRVIPNANVVKFFQDTVQLLGNRRHDIKWLAYRDETPTTYKLCKTAAEMYGQLGDCGLLPEGAVPIMTPQLLPFELQVAYVLCLGGYKGSMPLADFAMDLLRALLSQVVLMQKEFASSPAACKTAEMNLELAGGSLSRVLTHVAAAEPAAAAGAVPLRIQHVVIAVIDGLMRVKVFKDKDRRFDTLSYSFLQKQPALWQLRILSQFAQFYSGESRASAFLTSVCKRNRDDMFARNHTWLTHQHKGTAGEAFELQSEAQVLFNKACQADALPRGWFRPASVAVLPADLHCVAVCYAIGTAGTDASVHSTNSTESFVAYAWDLIHDLDPKADSRGRGAPSSRSRSQSAARAAAQPDRGESSDRAAHERVTAAGHRGNPDQIPMQSVGPHRHAPSPPPPGPQHLQVRSSQSPGLPHQAHGPHPANNPRHCRFFFHALGCQSKNCTFYHGTHQEYVAHMANIGLVPYGLKFVSDVGRDKWIIDKAVDALNNLMLTKQLPRGSFSEYDLRALAFLEAPDGEHSKLQLQAVRTMAERGHTNNPAQLLQSVCNEVQRQEEYPPLRQGPYPLAAEPYVSRAVTPTPELPFSAPMDEAPFDPPMFRAPLAFHPSPSGAPSSPLPFSQHPLPTEELGERDIPFPLLRYEEELLAGLLQLQHQHGPVESVDQLLMLQPGCAMPEGISAYFPGRDMADRVLALLQSRPWLFTVALHGGIAVTRRAREGLVYKRDVITYLYNALQDGVTSVTVAELGERVQQPHGITDVVLEEGGLAALLESPLFREDVTVHHTGPYGTYVVLQTHGM